MSSDDAAAGARSDLPLPEYDHLPLGTLQHRIRTLDAGQLDAVLGYERAHGARQPVLTILEERAAQLRAGAVPSAGSPLAAAPEAAPSAAGGSRVREETTGPAMNPPSHGTPANPAQPRSTG